MNLIASFADNGEDESNDANRADKDVGILQEDESANWIDEYQKGNAHVAIEQMSLPAMLCDRCRCCIKIL